MRTLEFKSLRSRSLIVRIVFACVLLLAVTAVLQSCGGNASSTYVTPTTSNPSPGVQLVAIKVTPATSVIGLSETRQLFATGVYSDSSQTVFTSGVTWAISPAATVTTPSTVAVSQGGIATGVSIGPAIVTATVGSVVGALQLNVDSSNSSTSMIAVLSVPYKSSIIDAAYIPQQTKVNGSYVVQEVNLDAEQFSSVLPVQVALLSSIPLPSGFVPSAVIAISSLSQVAVISYTSSKVVIIDASNQSADTASNSVLQTITAPSAISGAPRVTINGVTCVVCAGVVDPSNSAAGNPQIILSTSVGYYTLDIVAGTFTAIPFAPTPAVAQNFSVNPVAPCASNSSALCPYLVAPSSISGEVQILDLTTNSVTNANTGLNAPVNAVAFDPLTGFGAALPSANNAVLGANSFNASIIDLSSPQTPNIFPVVSGISPCSTPAPENMLAMGVSQGVSASSSLPSLLTTQTFSASPASGSCFGITNFPPFPSPLSTSLNYFYGPMPATPDGGSFLNGNDPNAITTFNSAYSSSHTNFGVLFDNSQLWLAKVNYGGAINAVATPLPLPGGAVFTSGIFCSGLANGCLGTVVYLPTPATEVITSVNQIDFGTVLAGVSSSPLPITVSNIGLDILDDQIGVQAASGTNAADFLLTSTCNLQLQPRSSCALTVTFTPSAASGTLESATLTITDAGGLALSPGCDSFGTVGQTVCLSGTSQ